MYDEAMNEVGNRRNRTVSSELASIMISRGIGMLDICRVTGMRHIVVSDLLSGRRRVTRRIANQLSALDHLSAAEWLALDAAHD